MPKRITALLIAVLLIPSPLAAEDIRGTDTYKRLKSYIDSIPAIDTHDHLNPFARLSNMLVTEDGPGMNLAALWTKAYYSQLATLTPWLTGMTFDKWWPAAKHSFDNTHAASFYRFMLPAFADLYGIDFETITDDQARDLNRRINRNYKSQDWIYEVVTERANIELVVNDPFWARLYEIPDYKFCALVFNVTSLTSGFHRSEYKYPPDDPYSFAEKHNMKVNSLDDYLAVIDAIFQERKQAGAVCIKSTAAYQRTILFDNVPRERAEAVFGKPREKLTLPQIKEFEDFIMWRLVEMAAKYDLPFQVHTGYARIQGSNPMLLVDLIAANPKTKFILFHGGYPWTGETAVIAMRYAANVWVDSCWLPTLSYAMARRAYNEWLDVLPSNKIMWGADGHHAEGVYGATVFTRMCLAEALTERIQRGDIREDQARRIARQIMRDNALELFPSLKARLWKHKGEKMTPGPTTRPSVSGRQLPDVPLVLGGEGSGESGGVEYLTIHGDPEIVRAQDPILQVAHICIVFDLSLHAQMVSRSGGNTPDKFVQHESTSYLLSGQSFTLEFTVDGRQHTFHVAKQVFSLKDGNIFRIKVDSNLNLSIQQIPVMEIYKDDFTEISKVFAAYP